MIGIVTPVNGILGNFPNPLFSPGILPEGGAGQSNNELPANLVSSLGAEPGGKEKVFVLHSGVNDPDDTAANTLKQALVARGVPENRILVMKNDFPSFAAQGGIRENIRLFRGATRTDSAINQISYEKFQNTLRAGGFDPRAVDVTFVGHSAGGQVGFALAGLDKNRNKSIGEIITLGAPTTSNPTDPGVKVTSIVSPQDSVVNLAGGFFGKLASAVLTGFGIQKTPRNLDSNDRVIETPGLGHSDYYRDAGILDFIAQKAVGGISQNISVIPTGPVTSLSVLA